MAAGRAPAAGTTAFAPRPGDVIHARWHGDGVFYRAEVVRVESPAGDMWRDYLKILEKDRAKSFVTTFEHINFNKNTCHSWTRQWRAKIVV